MFYAIFKSHLLTTEMNGVLWEVRNGVRGQMILFDYTLSDLQSIKMYKCMCLRLILFYNLYLLFIKQSVTNSYQPIREQADSVPGSDGSWHSFQDTVVA